jgi:hypothetical protein
MVHDQLGNNFDFLLRPRELRYFMGHVGNCREQSLQSLDSQSLEPCNLCKIVAEACLLRRSFWFGNSVFCFSLQISFIRLLLGSVFQVRRDIRDGAIILDWPLCVFLYSAFSQES